MMLLEKTLKLKGSISEFEHFLNNKYDGMPILGSYIQYEGNDYQVRSIHREAKENLLSIELLRQ